MKSTRHSASTTGCIDPGLEPTYHEVRRGTEQEFENGYLDIAIQGMLLPDFLATGVIKLKFML